ncbi:hypothetical protein FAK_39910 [Desulfoferula mesophila]|uniref:Uncharacterized protein n=1 Tax=Desulfoferula mesophila TaxID=3058419 RepID=A0AAU9EM00_9BACT|nr:hypothetical protein FAK_39910 [Desulfoferula mesophilus]
MVHSLGDEDKVARPQAVIISAQPEKALAGQHIEGLIRLWVQMLVRFAARLDAAMPDGQVPGPVSLVGQVVVQGAGVARWCEGWLAT